jgi:hypothetical protein
LRRKQKKVGFEDILVQRKDLLCEEWGKVGFEDILVQRIFCVRRLLGEGVWVKLGSVELEN